MANENTSPHQAHLEWCKLRALEYVERGELAHAVTSMLSDMSKHPGTAPVARSMAGLGLLMAVSGDAWQIRRWIEDFA